MSGEGRGLDRREAIRRLVAAGLVTVRTGELEDAFAASRDHGRGSTVAPYRPRFFTDPEYEKVARLVALIIPSDETPGAREARVEEWIDFFVGESDDAAKRLYRDGLARLDVLCRERRGSDFLGLAETVREEALHDLEKADAAFFRALKNDTLFGFYTSEIGWQELRWEGQSFHSECPACDHPEHLGGTPAAVKG